MKHVVFGTGKKDMVIIPGLSFKPVCDSSQAVADAYAQFGRDYRVWLFDRRSDCPEGCSIRQMAADTAEEMKKLGIEKADIFGVSQGGIMAQYIAADYPELVNKAVLASAACRNSDSSLAVFTQWNTLAKEGRIDELVSLSIEQLYSEATLKLYKEYLIAANSSLSDEDISRYIIMTQSLIDFDATPVLDAIKCPLLVIGCKGDRIFGAELSRELAEKTGAELFIYGDEFGHAVYDEAPDYKDRLMRFFKG